LKCDIAGIGGLPGIYYNEGKVEQVDEAIRILNNATERLAAEGIEFAYHNHAFEFAKLENGQTIFDRFLENGKFKFILDVYWVSFAGINPAKKIAELGDRVSVLHYKDMKVNANNTVTYTDVGNGTLDWDAIVAVSDKARWAMVEEDLCGDDNPIDALGKSYKFLTSNYDFI
jgi:sugar phosphate isomerase/epimerase